MIRVFISTPMPGNHGFVFSFLLRNSCCIKFSSTKKKNSYKFSSTAQWLDNCKHEMLTKVSVIIYYHTFTTILRAILLVLYFSSPWLTCFITGSLRLLNPLTYFVYPPPTSSLATSSLYSYTKSYFCFCFVDSTYKWSRMAFVFPCLYFT